MNQLKTIIGDYDEFLDRLFSELTAAGFDQADFVQLDHICYRVDSLKDYEAKKRQLLGDGQLLAENEVNHRPIAVFRLHSPIRYHHWRIDAIELPAPKPGADFAPGLEHAEFVLYDDKTAFLQKHSDKTFDLKSVNRGINPEIGFMLPTCGVKFHLASITSIIYQEHVLGIKSVTSRPVHQ